MMSADVPPEVLGEQPADAPRAVTLLGARLTPDHQHRLRSCEL